MSKTASVKYVENGVESIRTFIAKRYIHVWVCVDGHITVSVDGTFIRFSRETQPSLLTKD